MAVPCNTEEAPASSADHGFNLQLAEEGEIEARAMVDLPHALYTAALNSCIITGQHC
jgi:uncharacterized protein with GYD domain